MAITRMKNSGIKTGQLKYDSAAGGLPPVMAAPTATAGESSASVAFTALSGATSYTVISSPGGLTGTGSSSPITVSGLTNGTAYTFQVKATNSAGDGPYSTASNSVTPVFAINYYTASTTYTPSSYPATLTIYAIGGGGGTGGYDDSGTKTTYQLSTGGGGGGGFYSTASGVVVNSGSVTVTVGAGGNFPGYTNAGNAGGASSTSVGSVSAAGGSGGGGTSASGGGGNGGAGGSGGGAGGGFQRDNSNGTFNWRISPGNGGAGGASGNAATRVSGSTGTLQNGGAGTGGASASGGGGGGYTGYGTVPTAGGYNGINISGTNYGSGRGRGGGGQNSGYQDNGTGGFVIIQRTA